MAYTLLLSSSLSLSLYPWYIAFDDYLNNFHFLLLSRSGLARFSWNFRLSFCWLKLSYSSHFTTLQ